MIIKEIGNSGTVFTLNDLSNPNYYCPANIYTLNGSQHIFICDGYFGSEVLKQVVPFLEKKFGRKPVVLFNSHHHWDHIRGNCFFKDSVILSHQLTKEIIQKNCQDKSLISEKILLREIVLPNQTFDLEYTEFDKENIVFFHSPGHTEDSCSCFDHENRVLFAADNIEYPHPYVTSCDLSTYIKTMKKYLELSIEVVIPSHGHVSDLKLLEANLRYLEIFPEIDSDMYTDDNKKSFLSGTIKNLTTVGDDHITKNEFEKASIYYERIISINKKENILSKESARIIETKLNEIEKRLR